MNYFSNKIKIPVLEIPSIIFTLLLALYFVGFFNLPILLRALNIIHPIATGKIGLTLSIPILLVFIFNIFFIICSIRYFEKVFFTILLIISSVINYAMYHYGVLFDTNMVVNILHTNYAEFRSYLNIYSIGWVVLTGILPAIIIYKINIIHLSFSKELAAKVISILISLLIISIIATIYYKDYALIKRSNSDLNKMITPLHFIYSIGKYINQQCLTTVSGYKKIGMDAKNKNLPSANKHNLLIFVVGETARSMNYQINGYPRETNLHTKTLQLVSFKNVTSCGTNTAISIPCMFSNFSRENYSVIQAKNQDNLLDVLQHAGLNVLWVDNNAGCYQACKNIATVNIKPKQNKWCSGDSCVDEILFVDLQKQIDAFRDKDSVIVLHIMGSHGPAYYKRFPMRHEYFKPSCIRSDIQNCSREELLNTYDNSILYTDFVLHKLVKLLQRNHKSWDTSVIYVSDHGESLGEKGLYLHGFPYSIAPPEQTHVPYITWFSQSFINNKKLDITCLKNKAEITHYSHTNIFSSILGLMDIETKEYHKEQDMFYSCRNIKEK